MPVEPEWNFFDFAIDDTPLQRYAIYCITNYTKSQGIRVLLEIFHQLNLTELMKYCMIIKQTRHKNRKVGRNARS